MIRHGNCRRVLYSTLPPSCLSPLRRPSFPLLTISLAVPIHGNDKTVANGAIFEVGASHRRRSQCSSIASSIHHSRLGRVSHARPSRLVCRKSKIVTLLDLPFTRFNYAGLTSIKKRRTRSAAWHGIYQPHKPNIARLVVEVKAFPSS
jgi:hypothetical protein